MNAAPSFDRMAFHRALKNLGMQMRHPMHIHARLDSTNTEARRLAEKGAPSGTLVIADEQSAGRGRGSNRWISPAGKGLYLSLLLRPGARDAGQVTEMSLLFGAASAEALEEAAGSRLRAGVKWPNDLMAGERKIGGVLVEAVSGAGAAESFLVAGVGVNVVHGADDLKDAAQPATSLLLELGNQAPSRETVLAALCFCWERALAAHAEGGFAALRALWEKFCVHRPGDPLHLLEGSETIEGMYDGIAEGGALRLRMAGGGVRSFVVGQVRRVRKSETRIPPMEASP
jgi:BirA family biotin operon repressor/biotin-[acetyl-CoA-carboxylase] ligase